MPIRISAHSRSPPHNRDHHINHRRLHIAVAQEFLNRPDVVAGLQQVRCETMSQRVSAHGLRVACLARRLVNGTLGYRLVQMIPLRRPESRIDADS